MGRGKAIVIICFLENSSVIKGLNGAHTMGTSYLFREVWLRMLLSYVFFFCLIYLHNGCASLLLMLYPVCR